MFEFIPIASSVAGSCLTMANWSAARVQSLCFQLNQLLLKPGLSFFLNEKITLRQYCGWQGRLILSVIFAEPLKEGCFTLVSPYDGTKVRVNLNDLFKLFDILRPDVLLMPSESLLLTTPHSLSINSNIEVYFNFHDKVNNKPYCNYYLVEPTREEIKKLAGHPRETLIIASDLKFSLENIENPKLSLISDTPALDALGGRVYTEYGFLNLLNSKMQDYHEMIAQDCSCYVCQEKLSVAYLHHLFQQTPLLCQRFLIQHNTHYYLHHLREAQFAI